MPANEDGLINTSPRPRLLVRGFEAAPDLVEQLLEQAPTSRHIKTLTEVRQAEWDVLVTDRDVSEDNHLGSRHGRTELTPDLCLLFKPPPPEYRLSWGVVEQQSSWHGHVQHMSGHVSSELRRCRDLPERVAVLTHEYLEPILKQREHHQFFEFTRQGAVVSRPTAVGDSDAWPTSVLLEPFIETADGRCLAGQYMRGGNASAWLVPHDTPDLVSWLRAALAEWHTLAPERFPGVPDWSEGAAWSTMAELAIRREIDELQQSRATALEVFSKKELTLLKALREARGAADAYERALLTAQHDELRIAVMQALREFGLEVVDADELAEPGDDLEDLRATDPDAPGWIALIEVKGYTKGAKTEAIGQFLRFQRRFMAREGRPADAEWYIVNQFLGRDPSTRPPVLHGSSGDVAAFANANGLVVDTIVLFKLLMDVRQGRRASADVRTLLRNSTGRLDL